jgi:hypothetical protein
LRRHEQHALHPKQAAVPMVEPTHHVSSHGLLGLGGTAFAPSFSRSPAVPVGDPFGAFGHPAQPSASNGRSSLNKDSVIYIFQQKLLRPHDSALSTKLAHQFGVTAKTVRDIWGLRTWARATEPYWTAEHRQLALQRFTPP